MSVQRVICFFLLDKNKPEARLSKKMLYSCRDVLHYTVWKAMNLSRAVSKDFFFSFFFCSSSWIFLFKEVSLTRLLWILLVRRRLPAGQVSGLLMLLSWCQSWFLYCFSNFLEVLTDVLSSRFPLSFYSSAWRHSLDSRLTLLKPKAWRTCDWLLYKWKWWLFPHPCSGLKLFKLFDLKMLNDLSI